jgi:CheY-like chemotaxis protein
MSKPVILIVDDELMVRSVLEEILGRNYEIHFAENGLEGLPKAFEIKPDVIILDLNMPEMDGYEFLKELNPSPDDDYEVIVVTGNTENRKIVKCYDLGASGLLRKPFFAAEVRRVVEQSIERKQLHRKLKESPENKRL